MTLKAVILVLVLFFHLNFEMVMKKIEMNEKKNIELWNKF